MSTETPARHAAASERRTRVLLNGLAWDLAIAVATVIAISATTLDITDPQAWITLGVAVAKSVLMAGAAYVLRLKAPPTTELAMPEPEVARQRMHRAGA